MKFIVLIIGILLAAFQSLRAGEGMWLPVLIEKLNIGEMQANGFTLSAEDVYSVNKACMKDGIVMFGGGCTGVVVSDQGLVLTNHHCGFRYIQRHSTLSNDYLTDGFWARSKADELANPGLTVTFLREMRDVTQEVLSGVTDGMTITQRNEKITANKDSVIRRTTSGTTYEAEISDLFEGNQYYLFLNQIYTDVRLVGAPPTAVGSFGGDTDNWMWPRHSGDFSVFRIYADTNNLPKTYSDDNVPYKPGYVFPVSLKGVEEDDFTMVFGYPGTTMEYRPSHHLKMLAESLYPQLIEIRDLKLEVLHHHMNHDAEQRIKYAAKEAALSNSWKRWRGEINGLKRFDVIHKKQHYENKFNQWAKDYPMYANLLENYALLYKDYTRLYTDLSVLNELFGRYSIECFSKAYQIYNMTKTAELKDRPIAREAFKPLYKDFDLTVDKDLTISLLAYLFAYQNKAIIPDELQKRYSKSGNDIEKLTEKLYAKSVVKDTTWISGYFKGSSKVVKKLTKDPFYVAYTQFESIRSSMLPQYRDIGAQLDSLNRLYMQALMIYDSTKRFYPDANSSLRIAYGKIKGYQPVDGVRYNYYSTTDGILQKDNPDIYDYNVPDKLRMLIRSGDFGDYSVAGKQPVCFIATNHTTGGNSGSPVFNGQGHLIGLNFDRAWDGVMSDLYYNPEICRNISVDIRYILFIIDKFADAGYLLDEMQIIR